MNTLNLFLIFLWIECGGIEKRILPRSRRLSRNFDWQCLAP